ncbi:hypothetical protein GOP47_0021344 [Adiantum capillus-veneris]|uniref:Uncharacterized protein n=1 Tax=Adiantum capillus-veneris TaxID=13818 RepID=A0A9D4Z6V3_ADICA|nr:hypothetical protein GOP47_0021344 [Adiantum capillus-veneris]
MDNISAINPFPVTTQGDLLPFLRKFFSSTLVDVVEESLQRLEFSFLGERPTDGDVNEGGAGDGQWTMVTRRRHKQRKENEEESSARLPRGGEDGRMLGREGMGVVDVDLPAFKTPPKSSSDKGKRAQTLAQRFFAFMCHGSVDESVEAMYNPIEEEEKIVRLYHGTQSSSLEKFNRKGIAPSSFNNEFSASEYFYLTNSL